MGCHILQRTQKAYQVSQTNGGHQGTTQETTHGIKEEETAGRQQLK